MLLLLQGCNDLVLGLFVLIALCFLFRSTTVSAVFVTCGNDEVVSAAARKTKERLVDVVLCGGFLVEADLSEADLSEADPQN